MAMQRTSISSQPSGPLPQAEAPARQRVTRWTKALLGGLIAGTLFMSLEMFLLEWSHRGSLWNPVRLSASIAMGSQAVATSAPFSFNIFFIGMLVHYLLSIWYAVVLGLIIRKLNVGQALLVGAVFGLALYGLHFYALTFLYPWVVNERGAIAIVGHLVFGVSVAWVYNQTHIRELMRDTRFLLRH